MIQNNESRPDDSSLSRWISDFRTQALGQGIRPDVMESAFSNVRLNAEVIRKDRSQPEFNTRIRDYIASAVSAERVDNGSTALRRHADLLGRIEARFGVEREVIVAIWGIESAYGTFRGDIPVMEALATLAYDGRRSTFFKVQLIAALRILQAGDTVPGKMTGSWAGAMGHTQFMPQTYLDYAQDFDGDGRRDVWAEDPTDALASTASYLKQHGWIEGRPWGMEVFLPDGFDYSSISRTVRKPTRKWLRMGVESVDGLRLPDCEGAAILLPAGHEGAAFIIFENFHVLRKYNAADSYVIGVGHLADRLSGGAPIKAEWPHGDRALSTAEAGELQRLLLGKGFDPNGLDGIVGPGTIAAVQGYQRSVGLTADGHVSLEVLEHLRRLPTPLVP